MMEEKTFIDEILMEAEAKEDSEQLAYCDILILKAKELKDKIDNNNRQAQREIELIEQWKLQKNVELQERYEMILRKLEAIMRTRGEKTIDLPHGIMKIRKMPDRVEIEDIEQFMKTANQEMVTIIPEQVKPDLNKIKQYIKRSQRIPEGIRYIEGKEEFKLIIKEEEHDTES